jgi:hypothetical protein
MQDYGGPVGFRMAMAHPERVGAYGHLVTVRGDVGEQGVHAYSMRRLPTIVHETLVLGRCRYFRPMDSQRAILCNSHMNARSTLTRRRSLQVLATSLLAPVRSGVAQRRDDTSASCHRTTSSRMGIGEGHRDGPVHTIEEIL